MKIAFVGDVTLGRLVNAELRTMDPAYPWGDTLPVLRPAGARIANLECVLADDGRPWPAKTFHFRSDGKNVACVKAANLSVISLANNHVLDFGDAALLDMMSTLARNSIRLAAGVVAPGDED
jgi:poly-gamma-glutamate capsule biosynthesis protein CapA/YwtB (metallophosphatase superfamily)